MKQIIRLALIVVMALNVSSVMADKSTDSEKSGTATTANENKLTEEQVVTLESRLVEIRDIDKAKLTRDEKHNLRKEVLNIKDQLKQQHGVVIISTTALIIIILLIILL